jgi:hypothetical protein
MKGRSNWLASTADSARKDDVDVNGNAGGAFATAALLATAPPARVTEEVDMTSAAPLGADRLAWCISVFSTIVMSPARGRREVRRGAERGPAAFKNQFTATQS